MHVVSGYMLAGGRAQNVSLPTTALVLYTIAGYVLFGNCFGNVTTDAQNHFNYGNIGKASP